MNLGNVKIYLELFIMFIIAIVSLILLWKVMFKKIDKNNNGKIDDDEINDADIKYIKEMLKESILTIATGMYNLQGLAGNKAYNLFLSELKMNKNIFENIKENQENEKK